jgi:hypothetical protein
MDLTGSVGDSRPCWAPGIAGAMLAPSALSPTFSIFHDPQRRRFAVGTWVVGYSGGGPWGGSEREPDPRNVREGRIAPEREALRERSSVGAWCGEVSLRAEELSEVGFDTGVLGCGVVMCKVGQDALAACSCLGEGLAQAYAGARLPNGHDGPLEFEEGNF